MNSRLNKTTSGDKFLNLFPPPKFLKTPAVGLDITDSSIRFLEFKKTRKGVELGRFGNYKIPDGAIKGGKIVNKAKLADVLEKIRVENEIDFVNVSLPEEQAYLFQTTVPRNQTGKGQIRNVLEFKLEENVPVSSKDLIFDYEIIRNNKKEKEVYVNISAFPSAIIDDYLEVLEVSGLRPLSFELEAQSMARSLILSGSNDTTMIVDFGNMRTGIAIISDGVPQFTSTIEVGGSTLTNAVQKHFNVGIEEADKIKNEKGFARYKENTELFETLMTTISVLKDEINKHYLYWNSRIGDNNGSTKVDKIILCGGSANLAGITEYLSLNINAKVEVADVWVNVNFSENSVPGIEFRKSLSYTTAIGLALRQIK